MTDCVSVSRDQTKKSGVHATQAPVQTTADEAQEAHFQYHDQLCNRLLDGEVDGVFCLLDMGLTYALAVCQYDTVASRKRLTHQRLRVHKEALISLPIPNSYTPPKHMPKTHPGNVHCRHNKTILVHDAL